MAKLVIIRGSPALASLVSLRKLQTHYGRGTLLIAQDTVRRDAPRKGLAGRICLTRPDGNVSFGHSMITGSGRRVL